MARVARMESVADDRQADPAGSSPELTVFVEAYLPRLRAALLLWAGPDEVDDAIAETLLHLAQQSERVLRMDNPRGYLYRVGRRKLGGPRRLVPVLPPVPVALQPEVEPALPAALAGLPPRQRSAVYLMAGLGWTAREVGDLLGIAPTSVHNHYRRGLEKLRRHLGEVTP